MILTMPTLSRLIVAGLTLATIVLGALSATIATPDGHGLFGATAGGPTGSSALELPPQRRGGDSEAALLGRAPVPVNEHEVARFAQRIADSRVVSADAPQPSPEPDPPVTPTTEIPEPGTPTAGAPEADAARTRTSEGEGDPGPQQPPLPAAPEVSWHPEEIVVGELDQEGTPSLPPTGSSDLKVRTRSSGGHANDADIKFGAGCQVHCITSGVAYAVGTGAELVVTTDTAAKIWIMVWNDSEHYSAFSGHDLSTSFTAHFDELTPGSTYSAMAIAQDGAGEQAERHGSFETLNRHVRVEFGGVNVTSTATFDSYRYDYRVDGAWQDHLKVLSWPYPYLHPLAGSKTVEVKDAPAVLDIEVQAAGFRSSPKKNDPCEGVMLPNEQTPHGEGGCTVWGTAPHGSVGIGLDGSPSGDGKPVARSFAVTLYTTGQAGLDLEAIVLFEVWYE